MATNLMTTSSRAGLMDRRIEIQSPVLTRDSLGGRVETWGSIGNVWAEVIPVSAKARIEGESERVERLMTFRIRFREDLNEKMRLVHNGKNYEILGIQEIGRRLGLEILGGVLI